MLASGLLNMSEKTEQPTRKRRQDGEKEGQVIKSVELTSGAQLLALFLFFHFFSDVLVQNITLLIQDSLRVINAPFSYALGTIARALVRECGRVLLYLGAMVSVATVFSVLIQIGFVVASKAVGFKGSKLNPVNNLKQIVSWRSVVELLKSCLKVVLLCVIFLLLFYAYASTFRALPYCDPHCALPTFSAIMRFMWVGMLGFYLVLAVADYSYQRFHTLKQQRMSKEDIKQENKNREGDPHIKQRRRALQREVQSGSLAQNVRQSAVIVRNPTHVVVCLGYDPETMPVPRVLEKGRDAMAQHIVELAQREAIPMVENIPLARTLFYDVKCGERIPDTLFEPVAALLRIVLQVDYASREKAGGEGRN